MHSTQQHIVGNRLPSNIKCSAAATAAASQNLFVVQCDCWRPLRLPAILVGDSRLGGISTTLSAYETLSARGYDVPAIAMAGGRFAASNSEAIQQYVRAETSVFTLDQPLPAMPAEATPRWNPENC